MVDLPAPLAPKVANLEQGRGRLDGGRRRRGRHVHLLRSGNVRRGLLCLSSEIGGDHRGILRDRRRRTIGDLSAEVENGDVAADAHHQPHVVVDEQHGQPVLVELLDQRPDPVLLGRVHSRGGLIEDQQMGIERERPRDLEPSLVPVRQRGGPPFAERVGRQADPRQQLACLLQAAAIFFDEHGNRNQLLQGVVAPP